MVKLLPIPSLKKVRITKTKSQQRNRPTTPRQSQSQSHKSPYNQEDMMLQNAHGPVPIATFAPNIPKEMIPWLCTSIAIASPLIIRPRGKGAQESPHKELRRETTLQARSARIVLGL
jgi:hypothetical protein